MAARICCERVYWPIAAKAAGSCAGRMAHRGVTVCGRGPARAGRPSVLTRGRFPEFERTRNVTKGLFMSAASAASTERFYYRDTYQGELSSRVAETGKDDEGQYIVCDESIFHPQGGGQPNDKGTIVIGSSVFTVEKLGAPRDPKEVPYIIKHYVFEDISGVKRGDEVVQKVDMSARLLFARLHSAGHVLANATSELFPNLEGCNGNHFPGGQAFVIFKRTSGEFPDVADYKERVTARLREIVAENMALENAWDSSPRTVQFGDLQAYPCGGTHIGTTGEIGEITIRNARKIAKTGEMRVGYNIDESAAASSHAT